MPTDNKQLVKFICPYCKQKSTFRFYHAIYECFDLTSINADSSPYVDLQVVADPTSRRITDHTHCFYQCNNCNTTWERLSDLIYDLQQNPDNKL